jgi:hypothetical protein
MNSLKVKTPLGTLIAEPTRDDDYPGIFIDLKGPDTTVHMNLVCTEYNAEKKSIITHVWGDAEQEDPTNDVTHVGVEEYFKTTDKSTGLNAESPICYICSPYKGKTPEELMQNIENAKAYGRYALSKGYVPYIAHLAICGFLKDEITEERMLGMQADCIMLSVCDELWVFGETISPGMQSEIKMAETLGLPIQYIKNTDQILNKENHHE